MNIAAILFPYKICTKKSSMIESKVIVQTEQFISLHWKSRTYYL